MTPTVRLVRDYSAGLAGGPRPVPLDRAARYVRTRNMSRWHRPRSGRRYPDGRRSVLLWCGQAITDLDRALRRGSADRLDAEVCGTCEGRALGYGQDGSPDGLPPLVFSPTRCRPPTVCPGSGTEWAAGERVALAGHRHHLYRCRACGELVKGWARGGPYSTSWGLARHAPGDGLVPPCPLHGWNHLRLHGDRVRCECEEKP